MSQEIPVIYAEASFSHRPQYEVFRGEKEPHAETVERAEGIMRALRESGFAHINTTTIDGMPWIEQVHDPAYLDFLRKTSDSVDEVVVHPYV